MRRCARCACGAISAVSPHARAEQCRSRGPRRGCGRCRHAERSREATGGARRPRALAGAPRRGAALSAPLRAQCARLQAVLEQLQAGPSGLLRLLPALATRLPFAQAAQLLQLLERCAAAFDSPLAVRAARARMRRRVRMRCGGAGGGRSRGERAGGAPPVARRHALLGGRARHCACRHGFPAGVAACVSGACNRRATRVRPHAYSPCAGARRPAGSGAVCALGRRPRATHAHGRRARSRRGGPGCGASARAERPRALTLPTAARAQESGLGSIVSLKTVPLLFPAVRAPVAASVLVSTSVRPRLCVRFAVACARARRWWNTWCARSCGARPASSAWRRC